MWQINTNLVAENKTSVFSFSYRCEWSSESVSLNYGEGNGNPLQYSCLENPRDGGAWWAAVYGVAQSWTRLSDLAAAAAAAHWIKGQGVWGLLSFWRCWGECFLASTSFQRFDSWPFPGIMPTSVSVVTSPLWLWSSHFPLIKRPLWWYWAQENNPE